MRFPFSFTWIYADHNYRCFFTSIFHFIFSRALFHCIQRWLQLATCILHCSFYCANCEVISELIFGNFAATLFADVGSLQDTSNTNTLKYSRVWMRTRVHSGFVVVSRKTRCPQTPHSPSGRCRIKPGSFQMPLQLLFQKRIQQGLGSFLC